VIDGSGFGEEHDYMVVAGPVAVRAGVGRLYEIGLGVAKDYAEALRLYRLAAECGYAPAFSDVARFYVAGLAVAADAPARPTRRSHHTALADFTSEAREAFR
jgi:TPR repeat protein